MCNPESGCPSTGGGGTPPPGGACCFPTGTCGVTTQVFCEENGGTYQGDDTVCDPNPCPAACCHPDGTCDFLTETDCESAGGVWHYGEDCDPNPCPQPTGACCVGDVCSIETEDDCIGLDGIYQGDDTTCDPDPCAPATGACCFGQGSSNCFTDYTRVDCEGSGGIYQGDGSACDETSCNGPCAGCAFIHDGVYYRTKTVHVSGSSSNNCPGANNCAGSIDITSEISYDDSCNLISICSGSGNIHDDFGGQDYTWEGWSGGAAFCAWNPGDTRDFLLPLRCFDFPFGLDCSTGPIESLTDSCTGHADGGSGGCTATADWTVDITYSDPC